MIYLTIARAFPKPGSTAYWKKMFLPFFKLIILVRLAATQPCLLMLMLKLRGSENTAHSVTFKLMFLERWARAFPSIAGRSLVQPLSNKEYLCVKN